MTGRNSFEKNLVWHDSKMEFRRHAGMIVLALAVFLVFIPFSTAAIPGNSIFEIATTHEQMKFRFIHESFLLPVYVSVILYGIAAGISSFSFLLKKEETTFYFSIGITRKKLAVTRIFVGASGIAAAVAVPMTLSFLLNYIALGYYSGMAACYGFVTAGLLLQGLAAFLLAAIACELSGTRKEAVLNSCLFIGSFSAVADAVNKILLHLVWGNSAGASFYSGDGKLEPGLLEQTWNYNPLVFFYKNMTEYSSFFRGLSKSRPDDFHIELLEGWGIVLLILFAYCLFCMKIRKAEHAGVEGQHPLLQYVFAVIVGFVLFVNIFVLFSDNSLWTAFFMGFLCLLLFFILWGKIGSFVVFETKYFRKNALCIAAVLGGFGILSFMPGQEMKQIPRQDEIQSASISYAGYPSYLYQEASGSSSVSSFYMNSTYDFTEEKDIQTVKSIHRKFVQMGWKKKEKNTESFQKTVVPYDIFISYQLRDGTIKRYYYDRASLKLLEDMLVLDDTETVKEGISSLLRGTLDTGDTINWAKEAYQAGEIYLSDVWYGETYKLTMEDGQRQNFLGALAEDLKNQTSADRYFPEKDAVGVLLFTADGESDLESFSYHLGNAVIYLTESFSHTLDFLEENQLDDCISFQGDIESVTLQEYDPYGGINGRKAPVSNLFLGYRADSLDAFAVQTDFGEKKPITDKKRIRSLSSRLRSVYYMTRRGYLAAVKIRGKEGYVYKYLPGTIN